MKMKEAVALILGDAGQGLRGSEIAARAVPLVDLKGKTPAATIAAVLSVEARKPTGLVVKNDKLFSLRAEGDSSVPEPKVDKPKADKPAKATKPTTTSTVGKGSRPSAATLKKAEEQKAAIAAKREAKPDPKPGRKR